MPGLLVETVGGDAAGFNAPAGFGFGWGNGAPLHTWLQDIAIPFSVGASYFGMGAFIKDFGSIANSGLVVSGIDFINQDQSSFGPGNLGGALGQWGIGAANGTVPTADIYFSGTSPNDTPYLFGGNDCQTVVSAGLISGDFVATGLGFQPDLVIFLGGNSDNSSPTDGLRFTVGMMDAAGNQWTCAELGSFATGDPGIGGLFGYSVRMGEFRDDSCLLTLPDPYGNLSVAQSRNRFSFVSMDPDGFTLHQEEGGPAYGFTWFVALKINNPDKGFFQVGTHVQGDTDLGTYPLDPEGVFLCGHNWSTSIDGSPPPVWTGAPASTRAVLSLGGFDGVTNRSTVGGASSAGGATGNPYYYYDDSAIIFADTDSQTTLGRGVGSLGTLTANLAWSDDDGGARPFGSLAFRCPNKLYPAMNARIPAERP